MKERILTTTHLSSYEDFLRTEERAPATVEKYIRDTRSFLVWLDGRPVTKERTVQWKERLLAQGLSPATVNAKLSALNGLFQLLGWDGYRVKFLKVQRKIFRDSSRELTRAEYSSLVQTALRQGKEWLALVMETICAAGIRVSEVHFITVEAAAAGQARVSLKGKIREIILPGKLCRKLLKYARKKKTDSGEIFLAKDGNRISRHKIWREMKTLCEKAGVKTSKVFPHNLRHLFATLFYQATRDIVRLADVLGHSSVNTTRLYIMTTGAEHIRQLDRLKLVC